MKLNIIKITVCILLLATVGCTDKFEDINTNKEGITPKGFEQDFNHIKGGFTAMFNNIQVLDPTYIYQLQQGLSGDVWSGYMASPTPFKSGISNLTYALTESDGWNNVIWEYAYKNIMYNAVDIEKKSKGKFDQFYALSLILKVEGMHRVTDVFGPIIYSKYGNATPTLYDSQEDVYKQFFNELDIAVAELTKRADANEVSTFKTADISAYGGKYESWVRFANTLRLRLAMRIVKINPTLAKTEAEKAVAQKFGVMKENSDSFKVVSPFYKNPIATISDSWTDINMSADMESILKGYTDPRIAIFFDKVADAYADTIKVANIKVQFKDQYKGIRTGIKIKSKSDHESFSRIGNIVRTNEIYLMNNAEAYFLRAEGALRGWNMGGTAQELYEAGIKYSFDQRGVSGATTYIADNSKKAIDYVDPRFPANNATAVNTVTIAWDGAATNEVKLQKIITQKWIAGFPDGQEAWSDYRRTGYPKLFPITNNQSGGIIDSNLGVRRINFVQSEKLSNQGGVDSGIAKLGGPDNGATRLWWDTTGGNF